MKTLTVQTVLDKSTMFGVKFTDVERVMKQRLVRELAEKLIKEEAIFSEIPDFHFDSKIIRAEIVITDRETATRYNELLKAIKIIQAVK